MKTQFRRNEGVKCLPHRDFPRRLKPNFDPIKTQLQPNSTMPRCPTLRLATLMIRPVARQFADNLPTTFRNLPIQPMEQRPTIDRGNFRIDRSGRAVNCTRNSIYVQSACKMVRANPANMRVPHCLISRIVSRSIAPKIVRGSNKGHLRAIREGDMRNPAIIRRRFGSIHRSGCRYRSIESSDNRQMIYGNRQTTPLPEGPSGPPNRKVIVNRVPVIVNSAAWNLAPIHHQNAEIYHRAGRPPAIRLLESSDNHPTKRGNHPTESTDRPTIDRRNRRIDRIAAGRRVHNLP